MNAFLRTAIIGTAISLGGTVGNAQAPRVTMVVESVERAYRVGDLVVFDVKVTNSSKEVVIFKESQRLGWSTLLSKTADNSHTDLLAAKRQKALEALTASGTESVEDMGATLEVQSGENHVFRVPIETSDLNLQSGSYTVIIRRYDLRSHIDLVRPPFSFMLTQ
jgi:hypothetical protein